MRSDHGACLHLLSVTWPRAVEIENGRWTSDPEWGAPLMPFLPAWQFHFFDGVGCHALDWTDIFRIDLNKTGQPTAGEMRGFHVVFRVRVQRGGRLVFFDSDGSIIRRQGEIVHEDRDAHPTQRHELIVRFGEQLDIAHWQSRGNWIWGARYEPVPISLEDLLSDVEPYRHCVEQALMRPEGPLLKVYTDASQPVRTALGIYSLVLNGFRPAGVQVFGEYQWTPRSRRIMHMLLPFADIVDTSRVECAFRALDPRLVPLTRRLWGAMKICVGLLFPPHEYCFLDDDIFVLDRLDDALRLHEEHTLVYAPDCDYTERYQALAYPRRPGQCDRPLRSMSTGLYLIKNRANREAQCQRLLDTPTDGHLGWVWEQGFFAWEFSDDTAALLSTQRYFVPLFDGLPGGLHGYDWRTNPCEFACVHFGGPSPKPTDEDAGALLHDILGRHRTAT